MFFRGVSLLKIYSSVIKLKIKVMLVVLEVAALIAIILLPLFAPQKSVK